jgi:hypothetical protein
MSQGEFGPPGAVTAVVDPPEAEYRGRFAELDAGRRPTSRWARMTRRTSWPVWSNAIAIVGVMVVVVTQMHPNLLFLGTTATGGDTGAHVALPAYLKSHLLNHGQLTGWDPGWYDGFPI